MAVETLIATYPTPHMISAISRWGMGVEIAAYVPSALGSGITPTADRAQFTPILVPERATARKLFCHSGVTGTGNVEMALYTEDFKQIVTSGAIAKTAAAVLMELDITDTLLEAGRYYLGWVAHIGTDTFHGYFNATIGNMAGKASGVFEQASAMPLPATATPAAFTGSSLFYTGVAFRTLVL